MLLADAADVTALFVVVCILGLILTSVVICGMKGKYGMIAGGILLHILWYVGAIRIAKPDSWWARRYYGAQKLAIAQQRHG